MIDSWTADKIWFGDNKCEECAWNCSSWGSYPCNRCKYNPKLFNAFTKRKRNCNDCPRAYDNTCSGARAERCLGKREAEELFGEMRHTTPEEQKIVNDYIKSISVSTGINIWDLYEQEDKEKEVETVCGNRQSDSDR